MLTKLLSPRFLGLYLSLGIPISCTYAWADDYFNPSALELSDPSQPAADLIKFSRTGGQLPGRYRVDIYLNERPMETRDISFVSQGDTLQPELTVQKLRDMGVKIDAFPALKALDAAAIINDLGRYIPSASSQLKFSEQRLDISIPQAALNIEARESVDPSTWDEGLPAAIFNYSYSGSNTHYKTSSKTNSEYLNLQSGVNLGAWRLRNYSVFSDSGQGGSSWSSINTYVQRDIQRIKGQLTLGQSFTPSNVFDSFQFRGVQVASDDNMLPDSLRGFAPVVRGIAQSNAQVTVRQNGYIIYQTYVAPGAFAISDLYPTSYSGDLEVIIKEADGNERRSVQAFSSVPSMVREDQLKYSVTAGRFASQMLGAETPNFMQSTWIYGLPLSTTVYGGQLFANNYYALALGVSHSFGDIGSLSFDVTQARTQLADGTDNLGRSYRVQYAKDIQATGTTFTLAGYRYATDGYYDFQEANESQAFGFDSRVQGYIKRSRTQVSVNQSMGRFGNMYFSGYQQDYWARSGFERNISAGYNISHKEVSYSINYSFIQSPGLTSNDQQLAFSVQIPLDILAPNMWATYSANANKQGFVSQQAGISGTALADNNLNYSAQQTQGVNAGNTGNVSADYRGASGQVNGSYNYSDTSRQINYGVQGGVVVHPYGVTLSQPLGETVALVRAPGAGDVKVSNNTGIYTDSKGYAVVPYVSTYRKTSILLDTQTLQEDVEIKTNSKNVTPTKGAVVLANFETRVGSRVLVTLNHGDKAMPFGALVNLLDRDAGDDDAAMVGTNGEVYMIGMPPRGRLAVKWGANGEHHCQANFQLPSSTVVNEKTVSPAIQIINAQCY
ncbi:fimbrial assembly protein [Pseudomonas sp. IB20]|uniref:fimbria/pilus outer membrane usher protein n=1 Tax=Pseudomonas TaxID=286 RepID=UPI000B9FC6DF|nr:MULTISPECIES: fimbria/pilus outer membrane usher protein [unclassified Pseudomonas]MCV2228095.1 fimbrial biogenesis outer membrane usher protein [Pseudomonas sp. AU10]OZO03143.1 fimbrial assembly protein [Pseudomonas sp. IB20]